MSEQLYREERENQQYRIGRIFWKNKNSCGLDSAYKPTFSRRKRLHVLCSKDDFEVWNNLAKLISEIHPNLQVKIAQLVHELTKFPARERGRVEVTRFMPHLFDQLYSSISCFEDNLTREQSGKFNFTSFYHELGILNMHKNYTSKGKISQKNKQ